MAKPKVQSLAKILAELDPAYKPSVELLKKQVSAVPGKYQAQVQGLDVAKTNEFREINRGANAKGLAFSGMPIEEQTRYLGERYLPSIAALEQQQNEENMTLQMAIADLNKEKRLTGIAERKDQKSALQRYLEAERDRRWRAQEAAKERAAQLQASRIRASSSGGGSGSNINPAKEFLSYIANQFKKAGGQGNRNVTRQQQDAWANAWFNQNNVKKANRQGYWDLFNDTYNRTSNPYEDWRYKR